MSPATLDALTIALDPQAQRLLAGAIMIMMFAIALGLKPEHFAFLRKGSNVFFGGVAAQIIALPLVTLALAALIKPAPSVALGMIVVAACPGGNVSNFMTWAARGDLGYSVSLTAASSIIAALWTPAAVLVWSSLYPPTADLLDTIEFNRIAFVAQTTLMLAAPLGAGMAAAHWRPRLAERIRKPMALFGAGILAWVIIAGTIDLLPVLLPAWALILIPVIAHNAVAFATGATAGRLLGANPAQRRSLTIEVGIQNAGLAVVILLAQMQGIGGAAAIAAVWGVWHFASGGIMIVVFRTLDARKAVP